MAKNRTRKDKAQQAEGPHAEPPKPLRLEWRDPAELDENPSNWRKHPKSQVASLQAAMAEVGWAGALLYNERTGRLIDGHARRELFAGKGKVPVLIGNWDEATEKKILATLDPLTALAEADAGALDALLRDVQFGDEELQQLMSRLAQDAGVVPPDGSDKPDDAPPDNTPDQQLEHKIIVNCKDETHQRELLERFEAEGLDCKALIV